MLQKDFVFVCEYVFTHTQGKTAAVIKREREAALRTVIELKGKNIVLR